MATRDFSTTAASNASVSSQNWQEGQAPSTVNNSARKLLADIADQYELEHGILSSGGTANVQTLTPAVAWTAYTNGNIVVFKVGAGLTNTGSTTLNVSGQGAKTIYKSDLATALAGGELTAGQVVVLRYDSTLGGFHFLFDALPSDVVTEDGAQTVADKTLTNTTLVSPAINTGVSGTALADQSAMEAATATGRLVVPSVVKHHPGVAKAWLQAGVSGSIVASYNVASVVDAGTGLLDVTIGTDFSTSDYCAIACFTSAGGNYCASVTSLAPGTVRVNVANGNTGAAQDPDGYMLALFGDQA